MASKNKRQQANMPRKNKQWNKRQQAKMPRAQLARVEWKIDQIDARTQYLSRVINNVQNASDAIWGNTRPMMPWYFALPVAALMTVTTLWPLREAGTAVSPAIDGAYTYTRYAGEAVGAWFASIQYAKPAMAFGQTLRGLTNEQTADLAEKLRQRENGGRYQGWNKYGYAGAYQAGASALAQTGFIHRDKLDAAEDCIKSGSCGAKHLAFLQNPDNWAYGYSFQQFMDSQSIQDKFFVQLANYNIDQGFRRGVLRADKPSRIAGFVAVAHLQGVGAAVDYYLHGIDTKKGGAYASEYAKIGESAAPDGQVMQVASQYLGLHEYQDTSAIRQLVGFDPRGKQNAWCAGFVNAVLERAGMRGTGKLNAKSFLTWGAQTSEPKQGDIVVLWRGSRDAATGHVGFFSGFDAAGNVLILGGNQDNKVSVEAFERNRVLSFRRATTNTI